MKYNVWIQLSLLGSLLLQMSLQLHFFCKRTSPVPYHPSSLCLLKPFQTYCIDILLYSRTFFVLLFDIQYVSLKLPSSILDLNDHKCPPSDLFVASQCPVWPSVKCSEQFNPLLFMNIPLFVILISVSSLASYYLDLLLLSWSSYSHHFGHLYHLILHSSVILTTLILRHLPCRLHY